MKIEYKQADIVTRIDQAIAQARLEQQSIDTVRLTAEELEEFCELRGLAFNRQHRYRYDGCWVAYQWGLK